MGMGGDTMERISRGPQSTQSEPRSQRLYSAPWPPSSQSLSVEYPHVLAHVVVPIVVEPPPPEPEPALELALVRRRAEQSEQSFPS